MLIAKPHFFCLMPEPPVNEPLIHAAKSTIGKTRLSFVECRMLLDGSNLLKKWTAAGGQMKTVVNSPARLQSVKAWELL